jgi:hypothetical protein
LEYNIYKKIDDQIMKHLKTFEQHSTNEGILWDSPAEKFQKAYDTFVSTYIKKGVEKPTDEEKAEIFDAAKKDKYEGKMGLSKDGKKFIYRDSKGIVWGSEFKSGGSGGSGT